MADARGARWTGDIHTLAGSGAHLENGQLQARLAREESRATARPTTPATTTMTCADLHIGEQFATLAGKRVRAQSCPARRTTAVVFAASLLGFRAAPPLDRLGADRVDVAGNASLPSEGRSGCGLQYVAVG
jgi:hypothetical protein